MINTDKIAVMCYLMGLEKEIERLRGCWKRAKAAGDQEAMAFFERAANGIKRDIANGKRYGRAMA